MSVTTCHTWKEINFFHIFECNLKNISSIFMKFSGYMETVISYHQICIVAMDIHQCGFYGNIFITIHQTFYIFNHHSRNIGSIFMKISGHMGMVISYNHIYFVTMDIHQCGFHDNILITFHQTFLHSWFTTQRIFDQSSWNFKDICLLSSPTIIYTLLL